MVKKIQKYFQRISAFFNKSLWKDWKPENMQENEEGKFLIFSYANFLKEILYQKSIKLFAEIPEFSLVVRIYD